MMSKFLDDYLPPRASNTVSDQTPVYWAETFGTLLNSKSAIVKMSLSALTLANLSNLQRDDTLAHHGRHYYSQTIQSICALRKLEHPSDLIRTSMILALYELYSQPISLESPWNVHVKAAYNLTQRSGLQSETLSKHDLRRLCTMEVRLKSIAPVSL